MHQLYTIISILINIFNNFETKICFCHLDSSNNGFVCDFETDCYTKFKGYIGNFKVGKMTPTLNTGPSGDATFPTGSIQFM